MDFKEKLNTRWGSLTEDTSDEILKLTKQIILENSLGNLIKEDEVTSFDKIPHLDKLQTIIPTLPKTVSNKMVAVQPATTSKALARYIQFLFGASKGNTSEGEKLPFMPQEQVSSDSALYSSSKIGCSEKATYSSGVSVSVDSIVSGLTLKDLKKVKIINNTQGTITTYMPSDFTITLSGSTFKVSLSGEYDLKDGDNFYVELFYDIERKSNQFNITFEGKGVLVETDIHRIPVRWSKESEQDFRAYYDISTQDELVKGASMQMAYEADREILSTIDKLTLDGLTFTHDWKDDSANNADVFLDRHFALKQKILKASGTMASYNHISMANWVVVSPNVASVLMMLPDWESAQSSEEASALFEIGSICNGSIKVLVDPNRTSDYITLGFNPKSYTYGVGAVFVPFKNDVTDLATDSNDFTQSKLVISRYGVGMVPNGQFNYAKVSVDNL